MTNVVVNGEPKHLHGVPVHTNALDFLRGCGLTGAKEGCAEGECGACAVMVGRPSLDGSAGTEWVAVNSCLVPAASLAGQEVVTAEGLAAGGRLHPVQREMAERGGSQCGFCTPGFVCAMAAEYYRPGREPAEPEQAQPDAHDHYRGPNGFDLHMISGNLCRCTGYRPIRDAAFALGFPPPEDPLAVRRGEPATEPGDYSVADEAAVFVRPADLEEAVRLLGRHGGATLVAGSTDLGVEVNLRGRRPEVVIAIDRLAELRGFEVTDHEIRIGAALTLSEVERRLAGRSPLMEALFPLFASPLIRNGATLGGNLGTGSPIGDGAPVLLALEAELELVGAEGRRRVALADFFTGYRRSVLRPGELIAEIVLPRPEPRVTAFHKIAKRAFDDISSVAIAFALDIQGGIVTRARIGLGGVAATPIRALATEAMLEGRPWSQSVVEDAAGHLAAEGTPISDQRASAAYRRAMLGESLRKLFHDQEGTR